MKKIPELRIFKEILSVKYVRLLDIKSHISVSSSCSEIITKHATDDLALKDMFDRKWD